LNVLMMMKSPWALNVLAMVKTPIVCQGRECHDHCKNLQQCFQGFQ
jgi:hypothetical protein